MWTGSFWIRIIFIWTRTNGPCISASFPVAGRTSEKMQDTVFWSWRSIFWTGWIGRTPGLSPWAMNSTELPARKIHRLESFWKTGRRQKRKTARRMQLMQENRRHWRPRIRKSSIMMAGARRAWRKTASGNANRSETLTRLLRSGRKTKMEEPLFSRKSGSRGCFSEARARPARICALPRTAFSSGKRRTRWTAG